MDTLPHVFLGIDTLVILAAFIRILRLFAAEKKADSTMEERKLNKGFMILHLIVLILANVVGISFLSFSS